MACSHSGQDAHRVDGQGHPGGTISAGGHTGRDSGCQPGDEGRQVSVRDRAERRRLDQTNADGDRGRKTRGADLAKVSQSTTSPLATWDGKHLGCI